MQYVKIDSASFFRISLISGEVLIGSETWRIVFSWLLSIRKLYFPSLGGLWLVEPTPRRGGDKGEGDMVI
jgi:hypothetical protein